MNDDYLSYWGMSKPPFALTPDPDMLYLSTQHSECLMRLKYAIFSHKGGALLVSDTAGNGKTSVLARLQQELKDYYSGRVRLVFIDHPTLTPVEMIGEISRQLGGELNTTEKIRSLNSLRDRLFALYNENVKVVVIVDEGQMLQERLDILQELRILLNFCVSDAFLLTFIFSGQKPLDDVLRSMPEFWQRLPVRFFLKNLDFNDTRALIQFRLRKVGAADDIFTNDAFEGIYHYSGGCPRIICSVADVCLLVGYAKKARRIGFVEVSTACRDMESSGDSFHYFAYIKGQNQPATETPPPRPVVKPAAQDSGQAPVPPSSGPVPIPAAAPVVPPPAPRETPSGADSSPCPNCSEPAAPASIFCRKCGATLRRKCPKCGAIHAISRTDCSTCHANMDMEFSTLVSRVRAELARYDILEQNHALWLQANGIEMKQDEEPVTILPKGSFLTPGPELLRTATGGKTTREACDFILTARRFLIRAGKKTVSADLARVETCIVSLAGKRPAITLGTSKGIHVVRMPFGGKRGDDLCAGIAAFIRTVMLR